MANAQHKKKKVGNVEYGSTFGGAGDGSDGLSDKLVGAQSYQPDYAESERAKGLGFEGWTRGGMRIVLEAIPGVTSKGLLETPYRFQMPPTDAFTRTLAHSHNDFDTLSAGQHSRSIGRQLEIISFPTLVMEWDHAEAVWPDTGATGDLTQDDRDTIWNLLNVTATLERILQSGSPVQLKAGQPVYWAGGGPTDRGGWDVNMAATLRTLTIEERSNEIDTRYLNVEFHEWRSFDVKRLGRKGSGGGGSKGRGGGSNRRIPTTLEVSSDSVARDLGNNNFRIENATLHSLAKHFYGDPGGWDVIRRTNAILNQHNWTAGRPLGELSSQYRHGATYKIKIPVIATIATYSDEGG